MVDVVLDRTFKPGDKVTWLGSGPLGEKTRHYGEFVTVVKAGEDASVHKPMFTAYGWRGQNVSRNDRALVEVIRPGSKFNTISFRLPKLSSLIIWREKRKFK